MTDIGRIDLPTLLIIGENDPSYGVSYQREQMVPFLNQVTVSALPSGHFIPRERPINLARLISGFVSNM